MFTLSKPAPRQGFGLLSQKDAIGGQRDIQILRHLRDQIRQTVPQQRFPRL